jgi:hypothetical protein
VTTRQQEHGRKLRLDETCNPRYLLPGLTTCFPGANFMAKQQHYLITGGSGFLGINLIRYLLDRGHKVTNIDFAPFEYED